MSKRAGDPIKRSSKRRRLNDAPLETVGGYTWEELQRMPELQREQILYDHQTKIDERKEQEAAARDLEERRRQAEEEARRREEGTDSRKQHVVSGTNIVTGTPDSEEDESSNVPSEQESDAEDDFTPKEKSYIHPERMRQVSYETGYGAPPPQSTPHSIERKKRRVPHIPEDKQEQLELKDLRDVQLRRCALEQVVNEPYFEDFVRGLFVRIFIGHNMKGGEKAPVYRVCEIVGKQKYGRIYSLSGNQGQTTDTAVIVRHGSQKRVFKVVAASDSPFTMHEFETWKKTMIKDNVPLPSRANLQDRHLESKKRRKNFRYTKDTLEEMHEKKRMMRDPTKIPNLHSERLRLNAQVEEEDDEAEKMKLLWQLQLINNEIERRQNHKKRKTIPKDKINEIVRKRNQEKSQNRKRKFFETFGSKKDPFSRSLTKPTQERFDKSKPAPRVDVKEDSEIKDKKTEIRQKINIDKVRQRERIQDMPLEGLNTAESGDLLIKDPLWSVIHNITSNFCDQLQGVKLPLTRISEPTFGRNTAPSTYAREFEQPPPGATVLSLEEYLRKRYAGELN